MFRFSWSVMDAAKVEPLLKGIIEGKKGDRMQVADSGLLELYDPEDAGTLRLRLDEAGITHNFKEVPDAAVTAAIEPTADADLRTERAKALSETLAAAVGTDDAVKVWLETCEAEADVVVLEATLVLMQEAKARCDLLAVLEDRVRVLKRPGPGETKVLETWEKELDIVLNDEQVMDRYERGAQRLEDADTMEDTAKDIAKSWKARIQVAKDEAHTLLMAARTRTEKAKVTVQEIMDYGTRKVRTVRTDTGETISEREATERELQLPLPFEGGETTGGDSASDTDGEE